MKGIRSIHWDAREYYRCQALPRRGKRRERKKKKTPRQLKLTPETKERKEKRKPREGGGEINYEEINGQRSAKLRDSLEGPQATNTPRRPARQQALTRQGRERETVRGLATPRPEVRRLTLIGSPNPSHIPLPSGFPFYLDILNLDTALGRVGRERERAREGSNSVTRINEPRISRFHPPVLPRYSDCSSPALSESLTVISVSFSLQRCAPLASSALPMLRRIFPSDTPALQRCQRLPLFRETNPHRDPVTAVISLAQACSSLSLAGLIFAPRPPCLRNLEYT